MKQLFITKIVSVLVVLVLLHAAHGLDDCGGWHNAYCAENQGLTEVPADIPPNVWNIFLQDNEISVIQTGIFSNFTKCLKLDLDNNKIAELKPEMFDGLESLWELKLSNNGMRVIEPGAFLPLVSLVDLWLNRNNISEAHDEVWAGLVSLQKLYLVGNRIKVPKSLPVKLWQLSLQDNEITSIQPGIFSNLTQCQRLNLDNNMITELRPGMFDGLVSLWELKLSNNAISIIESGTFLPLENIIHLYLNGNEISTVQADIWIGLASIKHLYLQHNRIKELSVDSFVSPKHQDGSLEHTLQSLEYLVLNYNNLTDVQTGAFSGLRKLFRLSLSGNQFSEISGDIWDVPQEINILDLEHNQITMVKSHAFLKLHNIETIKLKNNKISNIESGAFYGAVSNYLDLGSNDLSDLRGDMWDGMNDTYFLNLGSNKLTEVRKDMWGYGLDSLDALRLSYNRIARIHTGAFTSLLRLRDLELRVNLLTEIDRNMWIGINILRYLDLGSNQLSNIAHKSLPKLAPESSLYLDRNNLTTLSLGIFDPNKYKHRGGHPRRLYLYIHRNPLHCDHGLCWFKDAQQDGWINKWMKPNCANCPGVDWVEVDLRCEAG